MMRRDEEIRLAGYFAVGGAIFSAALCYYRLSEKACRDDDGKRIFNENNFSCQYRLSSRDIERHLAPFREF